MSGGPAGAAGVAVSLARTEDEREACFALRYRVYVEEQGRRPPAADHARGLDRNPDDETGLLLQAHVSGELVGTARIHHGLDTGIPPFVREACDLPRLLETAPLARIAAISRLAIDARHRGGQTVVALLRGCFAFLTSARRDTRLVLILAFDQPGLARLYQLLGFRPIAPGTSYLTDLGPTIPMVATLGRPHGADG